MKTPQPWPDKQDEQLRETFLQELKQLMAQPQVDIRFADKSGFEGDSRPPKRWDKKGRKTRVTPNGGYLRMNVIGMVCPLSAQSFAIEASHSDSATFQAFNQEQLIEGWEINPGIARRWRSADRTLVIINAEEIP